MGIEVRSSTLNGVRILEADLPGVCCGTLVFGVGSSDEPPTLFGITHLVEHLLLRLVEPITVEHSAVVDAASLSFYASGSPDEVSEFFSTLVAAIPSLKEITDRDLKYEKRIIRIENPAHFDGPTAGLLTYRYGLPGIGASNFGAPTVISITAADIEEWAALWLRSENATFAISSPRTANLDLQIPRGSVSRVERREPLLTTPALVPSTKDGVALSLLCPRDDADSLQVALQQELFQELRHRRGLIYNVGIFTTPIDANLTEVVFVLDPESADVGTVIRIAVDTVRRVASKGFSDVAVTTARIQGDAEANRTFAGLDYLDRLATDALFGWSTRAPSATAEASSQLTSEYLTEVLAVSASSLIVAYDKDAKLKPKMLETIGLPVTSFTPWQEIDLGATLPPETVAASKWRAKGSKKVLVLTDDSVYQIDRQVTQRIRFADLVLVGDRRCGCFSLVDFGGRSVEFDADHWRHLKLLKSALFGKLEPSLIRKFSKH